MPWQFDLAVNHALQIANWQENLTSEDMPPRWLWGSDTGLVEWFEKVELRRQSKFNTSDNKSADADWEPAESYDDFSDEAGEARRMLGLA